MPSKNLFKFVSVIIKQNIMSTIEFNQLLVNNAEFL
ncbi:MAG: hypothetical protein RLZZ316_1350, partial [Bacteroidota bacterium]